jgi:leucyl aminopeptidase (aminopeptidase T)
MKKFSNGIDCLINVCAGVLPKSKVLIISDKSTQTLGEIVFEQTVIITKSTEHITIGGLKYHGGEPPSIVAEKMLSAEIIIALTKLSMAHSEARKKATDNGIKYLSLPDYSIEIFARKSMETDFKSIAPFAEILGNCLSIADCIHISSKAGTALSANIDGRVANVAPGFCNDQYLLASPPDAEVNIAPVERSSNGVIVIDGSITCDKFGLLKELLVIYVKDGLIVSVDGKLSELYLSLYDKLPDNSKVLAEIGFGLNPNAFLCGSMLEDEGCRGTVHFGFGSNSAIGGINNISFHLDHVILSPTVSLDGKNILQNGEYNEF